MTMRLSEAIREGCKYGPQGTGLFFSDGGKLCALGSAAKSVGINVESLSMIPAWSELVTVFPYINCKSKCAVCGAESTLDLVITCLNDAHHWTREAIAEFVEVHERKLGLWDEPSPEVEAELTAQVEAQYAQDAIHGRTIEIE